jgi:hypothetical protein
MAGATIIFCDIVGFSENHNDRQRDLIYSLNAEVTHELYAHLSGLDPVPSVIGLPTGDGMAIALLDQTTSSWTRVLFSLLDRLIRWSRQNGELRVGVHVGPISLITDINRRPNVCGATINVCQRVMDAASPNQVLFSDAAYQQYVGRRSDSYCDLPFSNDSPAMFKGPFNIVAKHGLNIPVHIMHRKGDPAWVMLEPFARGAILGKLHRTQLIANRLENLLQQKERSTTIYEQSAFSTFGITLNKDVWKTSPEYSEEYFLAAVRQRQMLEQLAPQSRTPLQLIINPVRTYDAPRMRSRFEALLNWMTRPDISNNPTVDFVEARYEGPNRLIVEDEFCIEGFKMHDTSGYEYSIMHSERKKIADAIAAFRRVFEQAKAEGQTKESVISTLRGLRNQHSQGQVRGGKKKSPK